MPWAEAFIKSQTKRSENPADSNERRLTYTEALHEALSLALELDNILDLLTHYIIPLLSHPFLNILTNLSKISLDSILD